MNSLALRTTAGSLLALASAGIWFVSEMNEEAKTAFALCLMLISSLITPRSSEGEPRVEPAPIQWQDRDIGQQFSMIMFHVVILAALALLASRLSMEVEGLLGNALAAALLCTGVWMTVRNWKKRNARR